MTKQVDLLTLFSLFFFLLFSNATLMGQAAVGISGGGGFTQSTGFRFALPMEIKLGKNAHLFGGPAFIQRRNRAIIRKLNPGRDYTSVQADYLSLPIFIKLDLDWKPVRLYGLAGIEVNYGLRLQATGLDDLIFFKENYAFQATGIRRFDGGVSAGIGLETDLRRKGKIFADLRYYLGLLDIDQSTEGEIYNEGTYLTLGFLLPIGKE